MNKDEREMMRERFIATLGDKIKKYETLTFAFTPDLDNTDAVCVTIDDGESKCLMMLDEYEIVLAIKLLEICKERFDRNFNKKTE